MKENESLSQVQTEKTDAAAAVSASAAAVANQIRSLATAAKAVLK